MKIGASSACYYPLETEQALDKIIKGGFQCTEIFFNTYSELTPVFVKILAHKAEVAQLEVIAVHPFSSFAETHCLFGNYERRVADFLELYKKYFDACNVLGATVVVIHGAMLRAKSNVPTALYFERFDRLVQLGKQFDIIVAQENVNKHFSESPLFLRQLKEALGADFHMVFDVKQAVRAGVDPFVFIDEFGQDIVHMHISDHNASRDCMPPGKGMFDFGLLSQKMAQTQYSGAYMIEIYQDDYEVELELAESKRFLTAIE